MALSRGGEGDCLHNTQNAFAQNGISVGLKSPPDLHVDRSAQSLREPWAPGFQRVTAPSVPGSRPCTEPPACSSQPLMESCEGSQQPFWSWKPPVFDRGPQSLTTPSDRGPFPTTPARRQV